MQTSSGTPKKDPDMAHGSASQWLGDTDPERSLWPSPEQDAQVSALVGDERDDRPGFDDTSELDDANFHRPRRASLTRSPDVWIEEVTEDTDWWTKLPVSTVDASSSAETGGPPTQPGSGEDPALHPFDALDTQLLDALEAPLETLCTCCRVIEQRAQALRAIFATLSGDQARMLHSRLGSEQPRDEVSSAFARIPSPYRARLRAFLDHHARSRAFEAAQNLHGPRPGYGSTNREK
jgi:hypothetical protein